MEKRPAHRPSLFEERFCDMLEIHMSKGFSYESFAGLVGVTRRCLYFWEESHPNFLHSKMKGKEKMLYFMEHCGIAGMTGQLKKFNPSTWIFTMKNKCGWSDKSEIDLAEEIKILVKGK